MKDLERIKNQGYKDFKDLIEWEKSYWYLRWLIETNKFGAFAKNKKKLDSLCNNLLYAYKLQIESDESEDNRILVLTKILEEQIVSKGKESSKKHAALRALIIQLKELIKTSKDFLIFSLTIKEFLIPTNDAIEKVPTSDIITFAQSYGMAILETKKEKGLSSLINDWDKFTEALALNKERELIVTLLQQLRISLDKELKILNEEISENEYLIIISAVCQEYERRVGQKRKQRAGNDLENVVEFILKYYGLKTAGGPEHFGTGLEVDNWIKDKKGWYIGISLKRTLRERWKQTYSTEIGLLNRNKIKYVIHILNNDADLSDAKISEMGSFRHLFFLSDNSEKLKELLKNGILKRYVFPISSLIEKLKEFMEKDFVE